MAACRLGASGLTVTNLDFGTLRPKCSTLRPQHWFNPTKIVRFDGLVMSKRSISIKGCRSLSPEAESSIDLEYEAEGTVSFDGVSRLIPNSLEVESLLTELCDTTSIAEFELKLHVRRSFAEKSAPPPLTPPVAAVAHSFVETAVSNGSASSPSLALTKLEPSSVGVQTFLDKAADEGLMILQSPRVGYFRRSRTIKGKEAPPLCYEKDLVKQGQVLCYIEQLGGRVAVKCDAAGEVFKIFKDDGAPVEYGDALMAILPSFPGIGNVQ